ncbi:centrosomal protein of 131 kDa isoform X2 [Anguilla anguilla]|uniref:centrosomal protein of 131 kDa isoform X2 n=1 Tax=Anguilla anguilla TaxID=7936 RepID=UPI0015ABE816|nr:centrosomal protein of 131 kDa isoform X2 [Anguilla anguilla]
MHAAHSPGAVPVGVAGDGPDLCLSGSQLAVSRRPSSASPGKHFSRSVSVSVAGDGRGKRNTLAEVGLGSSRSIKNLRRSNSTTQVNQRADNSVREESSEDFLSFFDRSLDGRRKLASLSKTSPDRTTWNILDDQPRAFPAPPSSRSAGSIESPTGQRRREAGVALAPNFTANNRSNKGAVGNAVTTILHNNHSDQPLTPKSSNQKPSFNNIMKATAREESPVEGGSLTKSQKNFSSSSNNNNASCSSPSQIGSPTLCRRREVTEEEAERFIQQVNHAVVTIQRWYRRHAKRQRAGRAALERLLSTSKKEQESSGKEMILQKKKPEDRKRVREEKARLARLAAIEELQQKRAQRAMEVQRVVGAELAALRQTGKVGRRKAARALHSNKSSSSTMDIKAKNTDSSGSVAADHDDPSSMRASSPPCTGSQGATGPVSVEDHQQGEPCSRPQSKTTLTELLDTLKLLEEEPEPKSFRKEKYAWIDEDGDSSSLTADNLQRHGQLSQIPALPEGGALLSQAKLHSIMSFLDEMEQSEQDPPRSVASGSHREVLLSEEEMGGAQVGIEQAVATAAEVTTSMMSLKLELEEKKRTVNMLQTALAQQRELTMRHVRETEKELGRNLQLQKEQYETTIQRHLSFIDQLIDDKKALSERCETMVTELKQVDQKYTKKITQMQEQHDLVWHILGPLCEEIKKLKELMTASEKIRREKWIDEKTKKIKEITVKGLEPEIQKLISKHKAELKKLRALHEADLQQADERAAQRYIRQTEELRLQLERERDQHCQRERELAQQRYEQQLQEEEKALQQQRRRLYKEVAEEKERLNQLATRQRVELDELRRQLEENSTVASRALREELDKTREEQERRHQVELKALRERLEIEKQTWEENYMKKEEAWLLSRERELKEEVRRGRDKEIELAIQRLEEETSGAREECERAAENRVKRVREQYEVELREMEVTERALQDRHKELKLRHSETEAQLLHLQAVLRHKEQEVQDLTQIRDKLSEERRRLAEVIRQEFAERLVVTEEENRRLKVEGAELRARLRLEVERVTHEKEEELAEVHQRVKSAILKKEETVSTLRKQHEAALKRADHLEALLEQQRKQLLGK